MPNQPRAASPFESLENLTKKAAQPVKQAAADVAGDVAESLGFGRGLEQGQPAPQVTPQKKTQINTGDAARLQQTRQDLARINQEMAEARKKREQKWVGQIKQSEQIKQFKQIEKKREDSVLQKMIKSRTGTKEAMQRASG